MFLSKKCIDSINTVNIFYVLGKMSNFATSILKFMYDAVNSGRVF